MRKLRLEELGRDSLKDYVQKDKIPVVLVLEDIRSAANVGSFFRTADAYMINEIRLCGITPQPPNRDIMKTAIGATNSVKWSYWSNVEEAVQDLIDRDFEIIGIEQTSASKKLSQVSFKYPLALVFGNEVNGVSENVLKLCHGAVELEQYGTKHSLNVSVCGGIVIWTVFQGYKGELVP